MSIAKELKTATELVHSVAKAALQELGTCVKREIRFVGNACRCMEDFDDHAYERPSNALTTNTDTNVHQHGGLSGRHDAGAAAGLPPRRHAGGAYAPMCLSMDAYTIQILTLLAFPPLDKQPLVRFFSFGTNDLTQST